MDSPFTSKLGTNYCPTVDETIAIKTLLIEPLLQMKRLDTKIAELQQALSKLLEKREGLQTYVQAHEALLSPIRRMPADVVQEIFKACLPTHRNCVMDASEAPLLLGRVCSAWRTLSLATPRLWASLHIVDPGEPPRPKESEPVWPVAPQEPRAALVEDVVWTWLERAGHCPLSISLQYDIELGYMPSHSIIQTIFSLASRWQHIRFAATDPAFQELVQLSAADVPELQSVELQYNQVGWGSSGFAWDTLSFLAGATIKVVVVNGAGSDLPQLPIEWTRLTLLSNLPFPDEDLIRTGDRSRLKIEAGLLAMSRCVQLRSLSFALADYFSDISDLGELPFVDHHLLQTLHLSGYGNTLSAFLQRIGVPQLKDLTLREMRDSWGNARRDSFPEPSLIRFLANLTLLESLSLTTSCISLSSLTQILLHLPRTLQHLHIDADKARTSSYYVADSPVDFLASLVLPGLTIPLPLLRDFDIAVAGEEGMTDETLLQFITTRATTLKRVKINFERAMDLDIREALSPLIENGLDFAVTYTPPKIQKYSPWTGLPDGPKPAVVL
ncbi:hypothetical protein FB45DRAFT_470961 [Roridomyces roridus]|uniref:F-box domain-containing protein n=1 Tax=Roridomyces roridus TaxID=1738132 RepID=A0AAD7FS41_9AGAR|nr:hypothetical protein FB45DRAFT_470961 [Roridomyces roridus]